MCRFTDCLSSGLFWYPHEWHYVRFLGRLTFVPIEAGICPNVPSRGFDSSGAYLINFDHKFKSTRVAARTIPMFILPGNTPPSLADVVANSDFLQFRDREIAQSLLVGGHFSLYIEIVTLQSEYLNGSASQ
jgi:hypothetical protein